ITQRKPRVEAVERAGPHERNIFALREYLNRRRIEEGQRGRLILCVQAAEIERDEGREDVARLAHDRAENLIVEDAVTAAHDRQTIFAERTERISEADARREVVAIRLEDARAPFDKAAEARREIQLGIGEGLFDAPVQFAHRRVVFVAQSIRE